MFYFITYPDWEGHWHKFYNFAVCSELEKHGIKYQKIVTDYVSPDIKYVLEGLQNIKSSHGDVWFFSMAQSPAIEMVERKPGRKYGHIHGLSCFPFEPAVLNGYDLQEEKVFKYYDKLFLSSQWSYENAVTHFKKFASKFVLTGFPVDFNVYKPYLNVPKQENLVVFNQRFSWERLPLVEIELSNLLILEGYEVWHLYPPISFDSKRISNNSQLERLRIIGEGIGMKFIPNSTKAEYHANLAKASFVITTSICDNLPVALIEAIYMGAVPIAPWGMCFPEFVHHDNLYRPYDINHILSLVKQKPLRDHNIGKYDKAKVIERWLDEMNIQLLKEEK
jgi:hypothetical protein